VTKIQQAYQNATITPQVVCQQSIQLLEYSKILILQGNPNAISDVGVAAFLADAAFSGGLLNIGINLVAVMDKNFIKKMNFLMERWTKKKNILMKTILMKLIGTNQV
jgi:formiminotetrahydrofolate cyclodeaminase